MKRLLCAAILLAGLSSVVFCQNTKQDGKQDSSYIRPGDNIVFENVPPIPTSVMFIRKYLLDQN